MRALAVDDQLELLAGNEAADAEVLDRELVLAVGREVVAHQHAAARAERQPLDVLVLRRVAGREVGGFDRRLPVADGHAGDARRGRRIGLEQRRRDRQRARRCCRSRARIVGRQKRRDVDLEVQQVANGVRVLGPVQAMQDDGAGIDARRGVAIDLRFQPVAQPLVLGQRTAARTSGGGITPARSLRTTFSHSSAWSPTAARSSPSSERLAVLTRLLWQVTQYWSSSARCFEAGGTPRLARARPGRQMRWIRL